MDAINRAAKSVKIGENLHLQTESPFLIVDQRDRTALMPLTRGNAKKEWLVAIGTGEEETKPAIIEQNYDTDLETYNGKKQ